MHRWDTSFSPMKAPDPELGRFFAIVINAVLVCWVAWRCLCKGASVIRTPTVSVLESATVPLPDALCSNLRQPDGSVLYCMKFLYGRGAWPSNAGQPNRVIPSTRAFSNDRLWRPVPPQGVPSHGTWIITSILPVYPLNSGVSAKPRSRKAEIYAL